jgi:ADP-dependent NAD(P)H-hydrate dehydratase
MTSPAQLEQIVALPALAARAADSNKGDFGRVLVVAGSRAMAGAAVLAGSAALRGGAGLVRIAVPREIQPAVAIGNVCCMTAQLAQDADGRIDASAEPEILAASQGVDVLAIGPGLGRSAALSHLLPALLRKLTLPIVLDADGLNAFVDQTAHLRRGAPTVLTPHPGEFGRLVGRSTADVQAHRVELATTFARDLGVVLVLKGHRTVVTDGRRVYENPTGNPGMATAGSGDVLTGLTAALIGQGLPAFAAAQLGAYVHGLAGDLAAASVGPVGMIATDLLNLLPAARAQALQPGHG